MFVAWFVDYAARRGIPVFGSFHIRFLGPVSVGSQYIIPQPPHSTSINDGTPWLNVHQPDTNYVGVDHGSDYAVYGQHHYDLYHDNLWYGSEGPPSAAV
jgi:hypothetical protein